jgi:hypothetical protein
MINKIIYFLETPFNKRDYERFGIKEMTENGFEVEVWDFAPFVYPAGYNKITVPDKIEYDNYRIFLSQREALTAIAALQTNCLIICLIPYRLSLYFIYRFLSKKNIAYAVFRVNTLPIVPRKRLLFSLLYFKKINFSQIINLFFRVIPPWIIGIKPARLMLAGGLNSNNYRYFPVTEETEILWLHALDYDLYLQQKDKPYILNQKIWVFLDENIPFADDYAHLGLDAYSSPEEYYPLIRNLFDFLEKEYDISIIIAAHPRSHYEKYSDYFGGRVVERGRTVEFIQKAQLVILHYSTAVNFAVLFKKPLVFITSDRLKRSQEGPQIEMMANYFGKAAINVSKPYAIDIEQALSINEDKYIKYKEMYIKRNDSVDLPFWDIVANKIKNWRQNYAEQ